MKKDEKTIVEEPTFKETCTCPKCKGSGQDHKRRVCPHCNGTGEVTLVDCPDCLGTGVNCKRGACDTCNGQKKIPSYKADTIIKAKESCAKFQSNPVKALIPPIIGLLAIASTAGSLWSRICIDVGLVFNFEGFFLLLFFIAGFYELIQQFINFFKGSNYAPNKITLRSVGSTMLLAGILTACIAGPLTTREYNWIEGEAISKINENFGSRQEKCNKVEIARNEGQIFYGKATFTNKETKDVVVRLSTNRTGSGKHRRTNYRIYVDIQ